MTALFTKYIFRNLMYYWRKYALVFFLILGLSLMVALSSFLYSGTIDSTKKASRLYGDLQISLDYNAQDVDHAELSPENKVSLYRDLQRLLSEQFKASKVIEISTISGKVFSGSWNQDLDFSDYETMRSTYHIDLASGKLPGEAEMLLPSKYADKVKLGGAVTFVYKDSNKIINSLTFVVSGFFLENHRLDQLGIVSQVVLRELDPSRLPAQFLAFLPGKDVSGVMTSDERSFYQDQTNKVLLSSFHDATFVQRSSQVKTSLDEFESAQSIVGFFLAILLVFLFAISIVAVTTIVTSLFTTLVDRIKIIGTMMSFGLKRGEALVIFSLELSVLTLIATVLGALVAIGLGVALSNLQIMANSDVLLTILGGKRSLTAIMSPGSFLVTFLVGCGIPFVVSFFTVRGLLKGDVVNLLYHVK